MPAWCHYFPSCTATDDPGAAQAEADFQQLTATVAQLRSGPGHSATLGEADAAAGHSSAREPSAAVAHSVALSRDTTGRVEPDAADSTPLEEALTQSQRRVADLEAEVLRLQQRSKRRSQGAGSWRSSSGGSSGGMSRNLLLQGLLASSDSEIASRVKRLCSEWNLSMAALFVTTGGFVGFYNPVERFMEQHFIVRNYHIMMPQ